MTSLNAEQLNRLRQAISKRQLDAIAEKLVQMARPAIHLKTDGPDEYSQLGNTRIGGVPDLPPDISWPMLGDKFLVFLAQINLIEMPLLDDHLLPSSGMLYFFLGGNDTTKSLDHRVIFFDGELASLKTASHPDVEQMIDDEEYCNYMPSRVAAHLAISLPDFLAEQANSFDSFVAVQEELSGFVYPAGVHMLDMSQLLGWPETLPGDQTPAEYAQKYKQATSPEGKSESVPPNWLLLFELDSHSDAEMLWWDAGKIHFMIREDDLARLDFRRTYAGLITS